MPRLTVVFLCTGNTCRSPLAAALARRLLRDDSVRVVSAGLQAQAGHPATEAAQIVAREWDASLAEHRARPLSLDILEAADWVIGMTRANVAVFKQRTRGFYSGKIGLLGEPGVDLAAAAATPPSEEVDDPYGGSLAAYRSTARQIERLLRGWVDVLTAGRSAGEEKP